MIRIGIICCNEAEEIELVTPLDIWRRVGFRVDLISLEKKNTIILQNGLKISCDQTIDKANINQYHAIYLPGGGGHKKYFVDAWPPKNNDNVLKLHKFLDKFNESDDKYIIAMCAAPSVLISLGLLKGRKFTCYPGFEKGAKDLYVNKSVCVEDGLITARAPASAKELAYTVIEVLDSAKKVSDLKATIFDYTEPMKK